jgi:hypothetical protein
MSYVGKARLNGIQYCNYAGLWTLHIFLLLFALHHRLCDDININNQADVSNLFSVLANNFENVVQYNKDNRAFEVCPTADYALTHAKTKHCVLGLQFFTWIFLCADTYQGHAK